MGAGCSIDAPLGERSNSSGEPAAVPRLFQFGPSNKSLSFDIMPKKKVDSRVRTLMEQGIKHRHRSLFVIVGDRGRDQVVNLHHMLSKLRVKARPSVLWCYSKELGFST